MRLAAHGIAVDLPSGWDGRIHVREGMATLHAANFVLPAEDADFGSGALATMPSTGVFVAMTEYGRAEAGSALFASKAPPPRIAVADLGANALQRRLPGQAGMQRFFTMNGRPFCLYVVVGSSPSRWDLAATATNVVRTIDVAGA